jgi:hypothetical protein
MLALNYEVRFYTELKGDAEIEKLIAAVEQTFRESIAQVTSRHPEVTIHITEV